LTFWHKFTLLGFHNGIVDYVHWRPTIYATRLPRAKLSTLGMGSIALEKFQLAQKCLVPDSR